MIFAPARDGRIDPRDRSVDGDAKGASAAVIGFGSNLGDRLAWLRRGRELLLEHAAVRLGGGSLLYESEPCGGPPGQGDYLNAALLVATTLPPLELLDLCQAIETACGRVRTERWGARTLDLDLLCYDDLVWRTDRLTLPHPHLHERPFALAPLCDLIPDRLHPVLGRSYRELSSGVDSSSLRRYTPTTSEGW